MPPFEADEVPGGESFGNQPFLCRAGFIPWQCRGDFFADAGGSELIFRPLEGNTAGLSEPPAPPQRIMPGETGAKGRFAGAIGPQHAEEFAFTNFEIDAP